MQSVVQVSLGHAHTLVLCKKIENLNSTKQKTNPIASTELYVFGSNHFGQLGIGQYADNDNAQSTNTTNQIKSVIPIKINVSECNIRLIHTKFFSNVSFVFYY